MSDNRTIRLRTTPGESQNIQFKIEQEFDTIDFLSLSITQEETYRNFCSDYGVVAGRVIGNDGFGIENAKISIFIPLQDEDLENQKISSIYPYSVPSDLNSQGIRYNLLPNTGKEFWYYQKIPNNQSPQDYLHNPDYTPLGQFNSSDPWEETPPEIITNPTPGYTVWRRKVKTNYGPNVPVGTFPNKSELLDNDTLVEVYEKYYKFTTKTNQSGDYMLFGVPVGNKIVHMDVDFSDIGAGSLKVEDFLNQGVPEYFFSESGDFKSATNLNSLPQIESQDIAVDVIPFWGNLEQCEIGITRQDFNLVQEIKPSSILMFSNFGKNEYYIKLNDNTDNYGGPGNGTRNKFCDIQNQGPIGVRVHTRSDNGVYESVDDFEDGNVVLFIPMTIDRVITNEFGQLVPSTDPDKGIPTTTVLDFLVHPIEEFNPLKIDGNKRLGYGFFEAYGLKLKFDLSRTNPKIYTIGQYIKRREDSGELTIINNVGNNTQHPEINGDKEFFGNNNNNGGIRYGSLWFPRFKTGNNGNITEEKEIAIGKLDQQSEFFTSVTGFKYSTVTLGITNTLTSSTPTPFMMDVTDVINLWDIFGGGLTSYSSKLDTYNTPPSLTYAPASIDLRAHTIPLRGSDGTGDDIDFPETLNTDQKPWPDEIESLPYEAYKDLSFSFNPSSQGISSWNDGDTETSKTGRYFFYWGVDRNNSVLHELRRRID